MDENENWTWRCLVCEKEVETVHPGDDSRATRPNLAGGSIDIGFGYGSRFDDMNFHGPYVTHQACVCDDCYEAKRHLTRAVVKKTTSRWQLLSPDYDKWEHDPPDVSLETIKAQLAEVVRPECIDEWLETPNSALGGRKPVDVVETTPLDLLHMIYWLRAGGPGA